LHCRRVPTLTPEEADACRVEELRWMRYGVDEARRGWCEPEDVANTRPWHAFQKLIGK
jgi:DNA polymerase (family 10)